MHVLKISAVQFGNAGWLFFFLDAWLLFY